MSIIPNKDKNAKPITAYHEPKTITPHKFALLDLLNVNFPFKVKNLAMKLLTLKNNDDIYCVNSILKNIKNHCLIKCLSRNDF